MRFNQEKQNVEDLEDKVVRTAIVARLTYGQFSFSLGKKPLETFGEFMEKAQKYMNAKDMVITRRGQVADLGGAAAKRRKEATSVRPPVVERDWRVESQVERPKLQFTPLNALSGKILVEIRNDPEIQWSLRMRLYPDKRDNQKFFHFHDDHGHDTDECIH